MEINLLRFKLKMKKLFHNKRGGRYFVLLYNVLGYVKNEKTGALDYINDTLPATDKFAAIEDYKETFGKGVRVLKVINFSDIIEKEIMTESTNENVKLDT